MATIIADSLSSTVVIGPSDNGFSLFGEALSLGSGMTNTVLSYTVPGGQDLYLTNAQCGGDGCGLFFLKVNSTTEAKCRIQHQDPNATMPFDQPDGLKVSAGSTIEVTVDNTTVAGKPGAGSFDYHARLIGKLI